MSVVPYQAKPIIGDAALADPKMLALIQRTVAKDCNSDEFDVFINLCRATRLDPLRKQAYAFIFKKKDREGNVTERNLTLVTSIMGFRTIADRTGNYRPDEDAAELHFDDGAKDTTNPLGFVKAVVRVFKHSHGAWHKVTAEAFWEEYAPIKDEWAKGEDGKRAPTGKRTLDTSGQWGKMPRVMLAKCAEAAALRKAFPDELSQVYEQAETDREKFIDLTASEAVQQAETDARIERIGGANNLIVDWLKSDLAPLETVSVGQFADRAMDFIQKHRDEPSQIEIWRTRNRHTLQLFWSQSPNDALALKKVVEEALKWVPE